jgi:hypothetical protein
MQERSTITRWNDPTHKAVPGTEQVALEAIELKTGHSWDRTSLGEIKLHALDRRCQGPVCTVCEFTFCIECGIPYGIMPCTHSQPHRRTSDTARDVVRDCALKFSEMPDQVKPAIERI